MGYVHRAHHCVKPTDANGGDIWECDECGSRYERFVSIHGSWWGPPTVPSVLKHMRHSVPPEESQ